MYTKMMDRQSCINQTHDQAEMIAEVYINNEAFNYEADCATIGSPCTQEDSQIQSGCMHQTIVHPHEYSG